MAARTMTMNANTNSPSGARKTATTSNAGRPRRERTRRMTQKRCKFVAFHEAGHAVAGYYYGKLMFVTVDELDSKHRGLTVAFHNVGGLDLAGAVAQARYQRVAFSDCCMNGGGRDALCVADQATLVSRLLKGANERQLMREWLAFVKAFVRDTWPAVKAVADALMERGTLEGEEAGRIIATAMGQKYKSRRAADIIAEMRAAAQNNGFMTIGYRVEESDGRTRLRNQ